MMRCFAVAALALSFWTPALGAVPSAKGESLAVVAFSTASSVFLYPSSVPLTLETILAHFQFYDRRLDSLTARFTQTLKVPDTEVSQSVEGTLEYLKPGRLRIEHARPERQTLVIDGKDIWIYRHSQNQVIQSSLDDWKKADPAMGSLMQFGDFARMLEVYDASVDTSAAQAVLILRPKQKGGTEFFLRMTLNAMNLFPADTELSVGSLRVRSTLSELKLNAPVLEKSFKFTPPYGADILRNFKPPQVQ
jgi:outer membrane lipoprotein carrier protein